MTCVLIVDDEQSICWGLSQLVGEMGHDALTASSAEEGLEIARQTPPDAIVLDIRLPGIDGLEAMERFHEILGPVPIIVITAYGVLSTAVMEVRNGAFDYITKPFDLQTAERTIARALAAFSPIPRSEACQKSSFESRNSSLRAGPPIAASRSPFPMTAAPVVRIVGKCAGGAVNTPVMGA